MKLLRVTFWAIFLVSNYSWSLNNITHLTASGVTKPLDIFSHATIYRDLVHVSCMQGFVPGTLEFAGEDASTQAEQLLKNLTLVLEQAGSGLDRVLKLNIYFADIKRDFVAVNTVINKYFPHNPPARSSLGVATLPRDAKVVMDCTAAVR